MTQATVVRVLSFAAVLLLAAACNGDDSAGQDDLAGQPDGGAVLTFQMTMTDNEFGPDTLQAPAGQDAQVLLQNNGDEPHTFTVESVGVDTGIIEPGGDGEVTFTFPDEPTEIVCTVHPEMRGTLQPE